MSSVQTDRRDGVIASKAIKNPVKAASTASLGAGAAGLQVVDGYQTVAGDRILRKNEADPKLNGIWNAAAGTWTRARDCDGNLDLTQGTIVHVLSGTVSAGLFYECTTTGTIVIGTSNLTWAVVSPSSPITLPLSVAQGGTGQITKAAALASLGVVSLTGAAGTANAQTAAAPSSYTAFTANDVFVYTPPITNTGAATLTITPAGGGALAAKNVFAGGAALVGGELVASVPTLLDYDGVQFNILGNLPAVDTRPIVVGSADATKRLRFEVDGLTAGATRTWTVQDKNITVLGQEDVATQAQQEAGSSTVTLVSPGRQQFHPSASKGWAQCTNAGSALSSYNVSSVIDSGVGVQTVSWNTAFSSANYCVVSNATTVYGATAATSLFSFTEIPAAGSVSVNVVRPTDGARTDPSAFTMVAAFGDQ